jgi:hypothetical protein
MNREERCDIRIAVHALIDTRTQRSIRGTWFPGMHDFVPSRALVSETTQVSWAGKKVSARQIPEIQGLACQVSFEDVSRRMS